MRQALKLAYVKTALRPAAAVYWDHVNIYGTYMLSSAFNFLQVKKDGTTNTIATLTVPFIVNVNDVNSLGKLKGVKVTAITLYVHSY